MPVAQKATVCIETCNTFTILNMCIDRVCVCVHAGVPMCLCVHMFVCVCVRGTFHHKKITHTDIGTFSLSVEP